MDLVREKGLFSFYEDGHGECCRVRKVRWSRQRGSAAAPGPRAPPGAAWFRRQPRGTAGLARGSRQRQQRAP